MEKLHHLLEMVQSSDHVSAVLAFLIGALTVKKDPHCADGDRYLGDNVPTTLLEGVRR